MARRHVLIGIIIGASFSAAGFTALYLNGGRADSNGAATTLSGLQWPIYPMLQPHLPNGEAETRLRELWSQEAMATWAFWMATLAALQLIASVLGIIFVARTLKEAQASTKESRKANETSQRNLSLMHEQQRAWIKTDLSDFVIAKTDDEFYVYAILSCKNVGQTPALKLSSFVKMFNSVDPNTGLGSQDQLDAFIESCFKDASDFSDTIMPGEAEAYPHNFTLSYAEIERLASFRSEGKFCPVLAACVVYSIVGSDTPRISSTHRIYARYPDGRSFDWVSWKDFREADYKFKTGLIDKVS